MLRHALTPALAITLSLVLAGAAHAVSLEASDNATVQPAGPRTGTSGRAFLNIEGSSNGNFASVGVVDFTFANNPGPDATGVTGVSIDLTESNAGFSLNGPISFYYTAATGVSIADGASGTTFGGGDGAGSVDSDFLPIQLLGSGGYTNTANGTVESFALNVTGNALTALLNAYNNGGTFRLIITPDSASTAATYAGYTNSTYAGPTLVFDTVVPEPASLGLLGLGGLAMFRRRRTA